MGLPPTVGQKIKNLCSKLHKQCLSFMLTKNYDNVSSINEVIPKTSSTLYTVDATEYVTAQNDATFHEVSEECKTVS